MIKAIKTEHIISVFLGLVIVLLPVLSRWIHGMFRGEVAVLYAVAGMLAVALACLVIRLFCKGRLRVNISAVDLLLAGFSVWYVVNFFIRAYPLTDYWPLVSLGFFLSAYILGRQIRNNTIILVSILLSGILQAIVAAGQIFGITGPRSWMYDVTGLFGGPAFLGMLLALALVAGTELLIRARHRWIKIAIGVLMLFICFVLVRSDSRTSWIAVVAGICYLTYRIPSIKERIAATRKRIPLLTILASVAVVCAVLLYFYKKDSADGRLLIWRISAGMIADNPVTGVGVGKFPAEYMKYQAMYFEKHPDSRFSQLADNISYPYNELLRSLCELGLVGGILTLAIAWFAFRNNRYMAILICWFVLALFSFPLNLPVAVCILPLAMNGGPTVRSFVLNKYLFLFLALFILIAGKVTSDTIHTYKTNDESEKYGLRYNPNYIKYAAKQLIRTKDTANLPALEDYAKVFRTSEFYTDLSLLYKDSGDTVMAKYYLKYASDMVPSRIYPRYCLFELYRDGNQPDSAAIIAKTIIGMTPKVENTTTIKSQARAKEYLEKTNSE